MTSPDLLPSVQRELITSVPTQAELEATKKVQHIYLHEPGKNQGVTLSAETPDLTYPMALGIGETFLTEDNERVPVHVAATGSIGEDGDKLKFVIVRAGNSWQMHGLKKFDDGSGVLFERSVGWLPITSDGLKFGRSGGERDGGTAISASYLWGHSARYGDSISRTHLSVSLKDGAVRLIDHGSTNGTKIDVMAREAADTRPDRSLPGKLAGSSAVRGAEAPARTDFREEMRKLEEPFSEQDRLNLWRFAAGTMNKTEAQQRGDNNGSTIEGQNAGRAYRALSPAARDLAPRYLYLMQRAGKQHD